MPASTLDAQIVAGGLDRLCAALAQAAASWSEKQQTAGRGNPAAAGDLEAADGSGDLSD